MAEHQVFDDSPSIAIPPIEELVQGRPDFWMYDSVEWTNPSDPVPVYICRFTLRTHTGEARDVFLFGARYSLSEARIAGMSFGQNSNFIEYFAVTRISSQWKAYRLLQRKSKTYSSSDEVDDYCPAADVIEPTKLSVCDPPRWKVSEAFWPTCRAVPMLFVGQVELPETELTRTMLTWDTIVYLFWSPNDDEDCFKIVEQDPYAQTAEEHYRDEAERTSSGGAA